MNDDDLVAVLAVFVPFAKDMLRKHGEFLPFAATVGTDGKAGMWGADIGVEKPLSTALIEFLTGGLRAHAGTGQIRAAGICFNVGARLPGYDGKVDAICCQVEHSGAVAKQIFVPYRKGLLGRMRFDDPSACPAHRRCSHSPGAVHNQPLLWTGPHASGTLLPPRLSARALPATERHPLCPTRRNRPYGRRPMLRVPAHPPSARQRYSSFAPRTSATGSSLANYAPGARAGCPVRSGQPGWRRGVGHNQPLLWTGPHAANVSGTVRYVGACVTRHRASSVMPYTADRPGGRRPMLPRPAHPAVGAPALFAVRSAHGLRWSSSANDAVGVRAGWPVRSVRPGWRRGVGHNQPLLWTGPHAATSSGTLAFVGACVTRHRPSIVIRHGTRTPDRRTGLRDTSRVIKRRSAGWLWLAATVALLVATVLLATKRSTRSVAGNGPKHTPSTG